MLELFAVPFRLPVVDLAEPRTEDERVRLLTAENFMHLISLETVAGTKARVLGSRIVQVSSESGNCPKVGDFQNETGEKSQFGVS